MLEKAFTAIEKIVIDNINNYITKKELKKRVKKMLVVIVRNRC